MKHNGMSYFPATIPSGSKLFHGTPFENNSVKGMEWLAFDQTFAYMYTGIPRDGDCYEDDWTALGSMTSRLEKNDLNHRDQQQQRRPPSGWDDCPPIDYSPGYLQTYTTTRPLSVLYIDGLSGVKTDRGTIDSQDLVLLNRSSKDFSLSDIKRATDLCSIAQDEWDGRIDGFVRANFGFEVILCEFEGAVALTDSTRAGRGGFAPPYVSKAASWMMIFDLYKCVKNQFWGLGREKMKVDFERMVSVYAVEGVDVWVNGTENQPRLTNMGNKQKVEVRKRLSEMILGRDTSDDARETMLGKGETIATVDWQVIVDAIVSYYSERLFDYAYGDDPFLSTPSLMWENLNLLIRNFVNHDRRNAEQEIRRCTDLFIPSTYRPTISATAVSQVLKQICTTILEAEAILSHPLHHDSRPTAQNPITFSQHQNDDQIVLGRFRRLFRTLLEELSWPIHKVCRGCKSNEVCFTAVFPFGTAEDLQTPSCKNIEGTVRRFAVGYWF